MKLPNMVLNFGNSGFSWMSKKKPIKILGHAKFAEILSKNGANVNFVDIIGHSPIHIAALNGNF